MSSPRVEYAYADGSANTTRAVSVTYPDGSVLSYDYGAAHGDDDRLSRVQKIADDGTNLVEYSYYGPANVLKTKYPAPNVTLDFAYPAGVPYDGCLDRFGRVKQNPWVKGSGPIAGATYQYDRAGNRTQMQPQGFTSTNAVERYCYDGLQRLTRSVRGSATTLKAQEAWGLDATGNWGKYDVLDVDTPAQNLAQQRTSNPANEITDVTETYGPVWPTPAYDRAGNTKSFPQPLTPTSSYSGTYDAWNRLVEVKQGSTVVATYQYDGLNRRVTQTSSGTTRHYYYSADWRVLEERTGTSTSADRQFFWGVRYVDDLVCRLTGTTRLYNCQDANWNTVAILDSSGAVQQRYRYSAYGTPTRLDVNGNVATGSDTLLWETLYAGYRYDRNTGLYQVRYRWLNPTLGCWITRDPLKQNGLDFYSYVSSSPVAYVDFLGLQGTPTSPCAIKNRYTVYQINRGTKNFDYRAIALQDNANAAAMQTRLEGEVQRELGLPPRDGNVVPMANTITVLVANIRPIDLGMAGFAFVYTVNANSYTKGCCCSLVGTQFRYMAFTVTFREGKSRPLLLGTDKTTGRQVIENDPANTTKEHELWHTDGAVFPEAWNKINKTLVIPIKPNIGIINSLARDANNLFDCLTALTRQEPNNPLSDDQCKEKARECARKADPFAIRDRALAALTFHVPIPGNNELLRYETE